MALINNPVVEPTSQQSTAGDAAAPAPVNFDVPAAMKAGYSSTEIADYLGTQAGMNVGAARQAGYSDNEIVDYLAPPQAEARPLPQTSATGAFAHSAAEQIIPTAGGFVAAGVGAELGGALGAAVGGPFAPITGAIGALGGGLAGFFGGAKLTSDVQRSIISALPQKAQEALGETPEEAQAREEQHPYASMLGGLAPSLLFLRPGAVEQAAEEAPRIAKFMANPITARLFGAGVNTATEAIQEEQQGQGYDPVKLGISAATGALLNRETALGRRVSGAGPAALGRMLGGRASVSDVLDAGDLDTAIDAAQRVASSSQPTDVEGAATGLESTGLPDDRQQAKLLRMFDNTGAGTVEQTPDGVHVLRTPGGDSVPIVTWNPDAPSETGRPTIPPETAQAIRNHYAAAGVDAVFYEDHPSLPFDGSVDPRQPGTVFISNNPQRAVAQVAGHEFTHVLATTTLPDGTSLGDLLNQQIADGITPAGQRYAQGMFGSTAPQRAGFADDATHAAAVQAHLVNELGADIGAEAPKFQTFLPRVVDAIQQRFGNSVAADVLTKLIGGLRTALNTVRGMFGGDNTVSQTWVANLGDIHDTLAKMYAERFGTQTQREQAFLAAMQDKAARDRLLDTAMRPLVQRAIGRPEIAEAVPPAAVFTGRIPGDHSGEGWGASRGSLSEGTRRQLMVDPAGGYFWGDRNVSRSRDGDDVVTGEHAGFEPARFSTTAEARAAAAAAAAPPSVTGAPEGMPAGISPAGLDAAMGPLVARALALRRTMTELTAERDAAAAAMPQTKLLQQTEAAILRPVAGDADRLDAGAAARLARIRALLDVAKPTTDTPEMAALRNEIGATKQAMAAEPIAPVLPPAGAPHASHLESIDPRTIGVDAARFQFKANADERGVTDRLQGVSRWDERLAGTSLVWRDAQGRNWVADGHQRVALANRLMDAGHPPIRLNSFVLDAADGVSEAEARAIAAVKNIAEGTGTAIDAAKVIRQATEAGLELPEMPPRSVLVRDGRALARLGEEAFGMAINDVVPTNQAALVGRLVDDPAEQVEAMRVLAKAKPENIRQAEIMVRDMLASGTERGETQGGLFGAETFASSVTLERAKILDEAARLLARDKTTFQTLVAESEQIEAHGANALDAAANRERLSADEQASQFITSLATRRGPVSDALTGIARRFQSGELPRTDAAREFLDVVRRAVAGGMDERPDTGGAVAGAAGEPGGAVAPEARPEAAPEPEPPPPPPKPATEPLPPPPPAAPPDNASWWNALTAEQKTDLVQRAGVDPRAAGWAWAKMSRDTRTALRTEFADPRAVEPPAEAPQPEPPAEIAAPERDLDTELVTSIVRHLEAHEGGGNDKLGILIMSSRELQQLADRVYGGTLASGAYTRDRLYDALETGVNAFIASHPERFSTNVDAERAKQIADSLAALKNRLPTQTVRAGEKDAYQQFSTPPDYSYAAAWVARIGPADSVLEPSAGTGSFIAHAQNADAREVNANELSAKRRSMLAAMGPTRITGEDAAQIHNILPDDIRPTVVVMNPPFSAAAERMGSTKVLDEGFRHVDQALARLEPGGRLVAIVGDSNVRGGGPATASRLFLRWQAGVAAQYDFRADIQVGRDIYKKYGTTFPTRLLVIDKQPPSERAMVTGSAETGADLIDRLKGVRDERPASVGQQLAGEPAGATVPGAGQGGGEPAGGVRVPTGPVGPGDRPGVGPDAAGTLAAGEARPGAAGGDVAPSVRPGSILPGDVSPVLESESRPGGAAGEPGAQPVNIDDARGSGGGGGRDDLRADGGYKPIVATEEQITTGLVVPDDQSGGELTESVYEPYQPQRVTITGAKPHPGPLVQSAAMASVLPPDATYRPRLPRSVVSKGQLSDAQLESVIYAGEAHSQMLPPDETGTVKRRGFFIGDGTGVGKGREVAGIILDNWQQGNQKAIWVSEKMGLSKDARRDWTGLGQDPTNVVPHNKIKAADPIGMTKGILFTSYDTLKSGEKIKAAAETLGGWKSGDRVSWHTDVDDPTKIESGTITGTLSKGKYPQWEIKKADGSVESIGNQWLWPEGQDPSQRGSSLVSGKTRIQQIVDWVGKDFSGVIAFDEAHNMGNAIATKGTRGTKDAAAKALAGVELQKQLPNARVVYVSATGATEVNNLSYADRLGLWGKGTAFANRGDFLSKISAGGMAAMELVARDMKALGHYMARNLSYDGVEYDRLLHPLTPPQRALYDKVSEGWQVVLRNFEAALQETGNVGKGSSRSGILSAFWGGHQRFFNQMITSLQMPTVIKGVERDIAEGRQAVLQLVNTNEAGQERALDKARASGDMENLEELDMSPRDQLMQMVERAFPVQQFEQYLDDEGNQRVRPVVDSAGKPVLNKKAVAMRENLLDELGSLRVPDGPLDILLNHFGVNKVAEVTGRGQRVVNKPDDNGVMRKVVEKRGSSANEVEAQAFQDAKKPILVFSQAGGTGRSYHADLNSPSADMRRSHYLVQAGWRADTAVQGFGRTHRTNQGSAPIFHLVTTDLEGQKRFISSIARRLGQLGALTKGERRTGNQGMFGLEDNLESDEAKASLVQFYRDVVRGDVDGITPDTFREKMGLQLIDPTTNSLRSDPPPMTQWLNRILSLGVDEQNRMFDGFAQRFRDTVAHAAEAGTLDTGVETYRADRIVKQGEQVVYTDPQSGAETRYVRLQTQNQNHPTSFEQLMGGRTRNGTPLFFVQNERSGLISSVSDSTYATTDPNGVTTEYYRVGRPLDSGFVPKSKIDNDRTGNLRRIADPGQAKALWDAQVAATPAYKTADLHLITGAVLPVWDRLGGSPRIYRLQTDDGQRMLGRVIDNKSIGQTLQRLGAEAAKVEATPAEVGARVLAGETAELANGWSLRNVRVAGEQRIELKGDDLFQYMGQLAQDGVFRERIGFETRYFVPTGDRAAAVIEAITKGRPITQLGQEGGSSGGVQFSPRRLPMPPSTGAEDLLRGDPDETRREYAAADAATREAYPTWQAAQDAYRAKRIDDAAFMAARGAHEAVSARFDRASQAMQDLPPEPVARPPAAPTIRNDPRQVDMFGTADAAVQAQAARDQAGRGGIARGGAAPMDEGLFAPKQETQPTIPSMQVPGAVLARVTGALDMLREVQQRVQDARTHLDAVHGGQGRYEADALTNRAADIEAANKTLDTFRKQALAKGIDPETVLRGLGGVPDLSPSAAASEWMAPRGRTLFSPRVTGTERETEAYTPEQIDAYTRVGRVVDEPSWRQRLATATADLGRRTLRYTLDPYIGVKTDDPAGYMALRNANTTAGATEMFLTDGTLKFDGSTYAMADRNGGVEHSLVRPLHGEQDRFLWWVAANRAERLTAEDRENLWSAEDIDAIKSTNQGQTEFGYTLPNGTVTQSREAIYMDSLRKLDGFNRNVLDLATESGLLDRDRVSTFMSNPFYVPFYRQAEGDTHFAGPRISPEFVRQYAFKTLKGGTEKLNHDLWQNAIGNWSHMIDASLRNKAARGVLETAERNGAATELTEQQVAHQMTARDKRGVVWVMDNGAKRYFDITDPMLHTAITALDFSGYHDPIMRAMGKFKQWLTIGVTADPRFLFRLTIRDAEQAIATAPTSYNMLTNVIRGFRMADLPGALNNVARAVAGAELNRLKLSDASADVIAGGGTMRLGSGHETGQRHTDLATTLGTPNAIRAFWGRVSTIARAYKDVAAQGEDVQRFALYQKLRAEGVPHDAASFAARDLEDFTLRGAGPIVRGLTQMVPFMNAWMQGLYKVGRAAADADRNIGVAVGQRVAASATRRVITVLGATTLLTLALDAIYKDDEDYKKRAEYDRNSNFWFKFGDTQFRIPMGFEIAAMSRIAANGVEAIFGTNEMTGRRFARNLGSIIGTNMAMSPVPQAVKPLLDIAMNESGTGQPIVPMGMQGLRPEAQYNAGTTLLARGLGSASASLMHLIAGPSAGSVAPVQIDYLINGYFGWLGSMLVGTADRAARQFADVPARPAMDLPSFLTGGMIATQTTPASRYVDLLYQQANGINRAFDTYHYYLNTGRQQDAQEFYNANKELIAKHALVAEVARAEAADNRMAMRIQNDPNRSAESKRVAMMAINAQRNRMAERAFGGANAP